MYTRSDDGPKHAIGLSGLSADEKPTEEIPNGSTFREMDTGDIYYFDEENETWLKSSGGGGGGGGGGSGSTGYKGTVANASQLPGSGNTTGDMYLVTGEGIFYVYDSGWKAVKETAITNAEIDALWP